MTLTETQKEMLNNSRDKLVEISNALGDIDEAINLRPDQEKKLATMLGEFEAIGEKVQRFLNDLFHQPG